MRLKSDLLDLLEATARGDLGGVTPEWRDEAALTVVMATRGYPVSVPKGSEIRGAEGLDGDDLQVFHAGTRATDEQAARQWRAGAERHRAGPDGQPRRRPAPMPRSTGSTGRKASAAATSAGGRWSANAAA